MHTLADHFRGTLQAAWSAPAVVPQPDDLDLVAMARLGLNYLRGNPVPARGYECRFSLGPLGIPVLVPLFPSNAYGYDAITLGDTDCRMDWQYAHMRAMVGEAEADAVEQGVRRRVLGYLRDDHLAWINPGAYIGEHIDGEWAGTWTTAKILYTLAETYARTGDAATKALARQVFLALKGLAQWVGDCAWYPGLSPWKDGEWLMQGWCQTHGRNYPFIVEPCVRYYECTGDEEALAHARAVADGFLTGAQPDQRHLKIDPDTGAFQDQVHIHTHAVWGVAHLGALLGEPRYLQWAERVYRFVLGHGTDYGWYPEFIPQHEHRTEICITGDMVSLAAWLARGGQPHYWDHVERALRNELRRSQFVLSPAFLTLFFALHQAKPPEVLNEALAELRTLEGGFVAQAAFDDWVSYPGSLGQPGLYQNGIHMMGCCPPEGMRAIWEAWQGVVEERPDGVYVNMCLTRDHPAARVAAARPEDGRLEVTATRAGRYGLRPPGWAPREQVALACNGHAVPARWDQGQDYLLAEAQPGDVLALSWPVPSLTQQCVPTSVPDRHDPITVRWVGNTVVGVEPQGTYLPMFTEEHPQPG
jgi:hypothetical protein